MNSEQLYWSFLEAAVLNLLTLVYGSSCKCGAPHPRPAFVGEVAYCGRCNLLRRAESLIRESLA